MRLLFGRKLNKEAKLIIIFCHRVPIDANTVGRIVD
jgi:hypothetical protein